MPVAATIFSLSQILNYFSGFQLAECRIKDAPDDIDVDVLVFDDLLTAMGITDRHCLDDGTMAIGRDDLLALHKVFQGEKMSCAEMAELIRRAEVKYKKENP